MKQTNEIIAFEKQHSSDLLKNILPEETALELKGVIREKPRLPANCETV